jgi:serine/threonine protein kinase
VHYFVARKIDLTLPKEISERFTYHVYLSYDPARHQHVVVKEIPSVERVSARLKAKFPDASPELIHKRAKKFTEKVFPIFLTREAAMLKLLARDLPESFRKRVPHIIDMEQDAKGFVHRMRMTWLRNAPPAGRPISQLEFAKQSAELLQAMHDQAGIIHLDLRLDNMVVTEHGVGFVDFGSAVRMGENIQGNPLLSTIYDELMRTSQIQRMLEKMTVEGMVTSSIFHEAYGKVDKGVDLFYLALQINKPLSNPDFRGLVKWDRRSQQAERLGELTEEVLKPRDPSHPTIRSAADLLAGIDRITSDLHAA